MPPYEEDLYGQQSSLMGDVNKYMSANTANVGGKPSTSSNPYGFDLSSLDKIFNQGFSANTLYKQEDPRDDEGRRDLLPIDPGGGDDEGDRSYKPSGSQLSKFVGDLQVLDEDQRKLLLGFITGSGGDEIPGVSSEEYAQLFGVSEEYAPRFQGYSSLTGLSDDLQNIQNFSNQQRGFELRAAQQANMGGRFQGGRGFSGFGVRQSPMQRASLMDTYQQRIGNVAQQTASKYGQILNTLGSQLRDGFGIAGNILQQNPTATAGNESNIEVGQTKVEGNRIVYWDGSAWVDRETYLRNYEDRG